MRVLTVWANSDKKIAPGSSAKLLLILKPQFEGKRYDQMVTCTDSNGSVSRIGLSGFFAAPVKLDNSVLDTSGGKRNFSVRVSFENGLSMDSVIFGAPGHQMVVEKNGKDCIRLEVAERALLDTELFGSVASAIQVKQSATDKVLCILPVTLSSKRSFVCKPSMVEFQTKESKLWVGNVTLLGNLDGVDFSSVMLIDEKEVLANFKILSSSSRIAKLLVEIESSEISAPVKLSFLDKSSKKVLGVLSGVFKGD